MDDTWQVFFYKHQDEAIPLQYFEDKYFVPLETIYQMFKARMQDELSNERKGEAD